ncbi:hypothetical protein CLAFUW4_03213 [Fulvia fulva]|uniref:Uncharacterized protein n=1 Tax=Passalora fulva TaxID=5499 RepID=A0A9Q8P506_PASFU|nr:uncharacterized protein CLAFUR5_03196 [Fulvia fulva]KAK4631338.1 hypothetical protein CLAFUR4_03202 [Fulvia fulva]KAK4632768.1 hypothetical protein CLAFUR0_03206 [Fulvia fulva]UJO13409.1 hypothetical protein CLAFUR5_03196 [Fulvia fulva]WPV11908.1 hypothetical protein CLAFUW4_03213 [Fulvia fulva]WPV25696.1 hypothetical protein CLAFUW7_03206 [Fulvia fulva]
MATMAFPSLSLPPLDDSMEVSSSPAGNLHDGDIDIDFDDDYYSNTGGVQLTDDEHMLEDGDPVRPPTATDEMMGDDENVIAAPVNEEVMQDSDQAGPFDLADEELIDYDDDDDVQYDGQVPLADTIFEATEPSVHDTAAVSNATGEIQSQVVEPADEEIIRQPEEEVRLQEALLEEATASGLEGTAQVDSTVQPATEVAAQPAEVQEAPANSEQAGVDVPDVHGESNQELYPLEDETKGLEAVESGTADDAEPAATIEGETASTEMHYRKPPPQLPGTLYTSTRQVSEGPPTPTDTGLHPMTVRYGHHALPLFKSRNQLDGLLKNDNLANVSLSDLIKSCRERLPVTTGETVSDDQNLILCFDTMGLFLVEDSSAASEISLQDVLDVYLLLHRNDGYDDVPPLSLTLTVQHKFTSHLEMYKQAASEGKGLSSFAIAQLPDDDHYDEEAEQEGAYEDANDTEQTLVEDVNGNEEDATAEHDHAQDFTENAAEGEHEQYDENNDYAEEGDYSGQHEGQEYIEDTNYEEYDEHAEYPDPEEEFDGSAEDSAVAPVADHSDAHTHDENVNSEAVALDSAASSANVQAAHKNDVTDTAAEDSRHELAPLTEEHDYAEDLNFDEAYAAAHHDDGGQDPATVEGTANDELGLDFGAEDPYNADLAYPEPEEADVQQHPEAGEELAQHEEHNEGHADHLENGVEGEAQPQDDDQFHTAFDLLDGEHPEDGPGDEAPTDAQDQPAATAEEVEDNIIFDDDVEEDASNDRPAEAAANNSPLGKRSFEEHADDDLFDFGEEEPDLKKARSG